MIWHRNQKPPTKAESDRIALIMTLSCPVCALVGDMRQRKIECHHIVRGVRLGHWYTLQICDGHHRAVWTDQVVQVAICNGRHAFREAHGYDDLEFWQRQQVVLGLDDSLPRSKILPRRVA
jgi:hypothetical protein